MFDFDSIPKYCINLARRPDRRIHAESQFIKHGLKVEFVTAVDGDDLIMPELSTKNHEPYAKGNWGCVLSHLSIINRTTEELIFICEDDVQLRDDFGEHMRRIESEAPEFDIFYLGGGFKAGEHLTGGFHSVTEMSCTHAYILRRNAAEFIARNITYNYGIDEFYSREVLSRFKGVTYFPMIATQAGLRSDIGGPR